MIDSEDPRNKIESEDSDADKERKKNDANVYPSFVACKFIFIFIFPFTNISRIVDFFNRICESEKKNK